MIEDDDERHAVWAALVAMVDDVHAPQDNLTAEQWRAAERVLQRLDEEIEGGRTVTELRPTPELLAAARWIAARQWIIGPEDSYAPSDDPNLYRMWQHGLITLHYASPSRQQEGTDEDRWTLTEAGRAWLRHAEANAKQHHTSGPTP